MRRVVALVSLLLSVFAMPSIAAEAPYTKAAFDGLLASGKPVAVVFHADWCPTCRAQAPVLKQLSNDGEFKDLTVLVADFDSEKTLKKSLNVVTQSTIVVFRGGKEVARGTGQTDREHLAGLLHAALTTSG